MASLRPAPSMRRPMFFTLPSVAGLAFKRLMASKAREYSSKPTKPTKGPVIKPISNRFPPLIPGPMIIVKTVQLPPSPGSVKIPAHKESPAPMEAKPSTAPEDYHVIDIYMRNGWRWLFPRGQCPEVPWWHPALKPAESSAADLRWTSGVMYRSFWKRVRTVLGVSVIASSLPATAIAQGVIMIAEGPVSTAMYLGIFAAVALPGLVWGIYRSRIVPEAWVGLVGSKMPRSGTSMMPTVPPMSQWSYTWRFLPIKLKRGDVVSICNPVQFDSRFDAKDAYYLGKRVIGLENDVIRTGELGVTNRPYFQVPKDHIFVVGDNIQHSLDSRHFGPVPLTNCRGRRTLWTAVEKPNLWRDWQKLPTLVDVNRLIVTDPKELERTKCEWKDRSIDKEPWETRTHLSGENRMSAYRPVHYSPVRRVRKR